MTELSPAAQAVLGAFSREARPEPHHQREAIAAALRAAADQVQHHWDGMECVDHLQAIAAELEGAKAEPPRRHVFPTPHQIAECGGPCEQGGPEACDCGLYERSASKSTHTNQAMQDLKNHDIARMLRTQAWERAKGELRSMMHTFQSTVGYSTGSKHERLDAAVEAFITEIEDNGLQE